jgi:DNA-binding CsgD family transcriptional regulator
MSTQELFKETTYSAHEKVDLKQSRFAKSEIEPIRALRNLLSAEELLDGRSHFVILRSGEVLAGSRSSRNALKECDCFSIRDNRLEMRHTPEHDTWSDVTALASGTSATLVQPCETTGGHCILRIASMCENTLLATIQRANEKVQAKLADLVTTFGLTPSEAHVIELLVSGHRPAEIGEELAISVHTVRAHLRHCYEKLDVSNREELWQKLAPYHLR